MFFKRKKDTAIMACSNGQVINLKDIDDPMFSAGLMGPGLAIEAIDGKVYSPVAGKITMIFPTKHALGIELNDGKQILIHVGIDTVNLKGEGFVSYVENGQMVNAGDLLLDVDIDLLKAKGFQTAVIMCISEPKEIAVEIVAKNQAVTISDEVMKIKG